MHYLAQRLGRRVGGSSGTNLIDTRRNGRNQTLKLIPLPCQPGLIVIGIFVANADGSILLATHSTIASEFDALSSSSWLITSFVLAGAATQTLVSVGGVELYSGE